MSVNIELPSDESLRLLAPDKTKESILKPMALVKSGSAENKTDLVRYKKAPQFVPAGQSTQMIIGASPETDYHILNLTAALYKKYSLKRVFFSAYVPVLEGTNLPAIDTKPPLLREHRLYQADWLLRFYRFDAAELLDEENPNFNPLVDPKCNWALRHMDWFPVEINTAAYDILLRVPGVGVRSAQRIVAARRASRLDFDGLKKIGVVLKRAQYFITCGGKPRLGVSLSHESVLRGLLSDSARERMNLNAPEQLSLFDTTREDLQKCLTGVI
jgi:putative DNA modification/repair radical SAM protein